MNTGKNQTQGKEGRPSIREDEPPKRERRSRPVEDEKDEARDHVPTRGSAIGRTRSEEKEEEPPRRSRRPIEEEKAPERSSRRERPERGSAKDNPCPHGHKFGVDIDETDDCPECNKYDDCLDEAEKIKANK